MENGNEAYDRSLRIKHLRLLAGFDSVKEFSDRLGIPYGTMKSWETATYKSLTPKGATRIATLIKSLGVLVEPAWLLFGSGDNPKKISSIQKYSGLEDVINYKHSIIEKEKNNFLNTYKGGFVYEIIDEAMAPIYFPKNLLFALWTDTKNITICDKSICLIETTKNEIFCRMLESTGESNLYHGIAINTLSSSSYHKYNIFVKRIGYILKTLKPPTNLI